MDTAAYLLAVVLATSTDSGPLSVYRPGDGHNRGILACGGKFTEAQVHIAYRRWRQVGCRTWVLVHSRQTGRSVLARVMDAGPFGIVNGKGAWRVWTKSYKAPAGWRFRGKVDLSWGLWKRLGKPKFLSRAEMYFLTVEAARRVRALLRRSSARPVVGALDVPAAGRGEHGARDTRRSFAGRVIVESLSGSCGSGPCSLRVPSPGLHL